LRGEFFSFYSCLQMSAAVAGLYGQGLSLPASFIRDERAADLPCPYTYPGPVARK